MPDLLTTKQAADTLGLTVQRIRQLIHQDRLTATRLGRDWLIDRADLATVNRGVQGWPKGRPRKETVAMLTTVNDAYRSYCEAFGSEEPVWDRDQFQGWMFENIGKRWDEVTDDDMTAAYEASLADA